MKTPLPRAFQRIADTLDDVVWRPEIAVEPMAAPQRIAPFALAMTGDVRVADDELGTGRLIVLHDPDGNAAWDGDVRCVMFVRALVEPEMIADPLLHEVAWTWLTDALEAHDAAFIAASGTVTAVTSRSFGDLGPDAKAEVEIRASWTPLLASDGSGAEPHFAAWADILCTAAGLPPMPVGVTMLSPRSRARSTR